jgi:hypothetical protein
MTSIINLYQALGGGWYDDSDGKEDINQFKSNDNEKQ